MRQSPLADAVRTDAGVLSTGKYDVAASVGADLFKAVKDSGAEYCVTECGTCRLQISHHTGVPSMHPLSWLRKLVK